MPMFSERYFMTEDEKALDDARIAKDTETQREDYKRHRDQVDSKRATARKKYREEYLKLKAEIKAAKRKDRDLTNSFFKLKKEAERSYQKKIQPIEKELDRVGDKLIAMENKLYTKFGE